MKPDSCFLFQEKGLSRCPWCACCVNHLPTYQESGGGDAVEAQWEKGVDVSLITLCEGATQDAARRADSALLLRPKNQKRCSFSQRALAFIVIQERTGLHPYSLRLHFTWHYDIIDRCVITVVVSPLWYSCLQWIKLQESLYCVYKMHLALMEVMFQGLWIFALLSTTWLHNLITISQVPLGKSWMDAVADQK